MLNKICNIIIDFVRGFKKYEVSAKKILEFGSVEIALKQMPVCDDCITVTDMSEVEKIEKQLPINYRFVDTKIDQPNIVVPKQFFKFFKNGGSFRDIEKFNAVFNYGRFAGKKHRLIIT